MDRLEQKRSQLQDVVATRHNRGLTVGQVMTPTPSCVAPGTSALEIVRLFHAHQFRHLLVTSAEGHLLGIISDRDVLGSIGVLEAAARSTLEEVTAAEIMSIDLLTVTPETGLAEAVDLMLCHGISCLPVLDGGVVVGIVTNTDLEVALEAMLLARA